METKEKLSIDYQLEELGLTHKHVRGEGHHIFNAKGVELACWISYDHTWIWLRGYEKGLQAKAEGAKANDDTN